MPVPVVFNGVTYQIPVEGDKKWAPPLTRYLVALAAGALSTLTGTTNEIILTSITGGFNFSLPQAIAQTSFPTFAGATFGFPGGPSGFNGVNLTTANPIRFWDSTISTFISIGAPGGAFGPTYFLTLPATQGGVGDFLQNDGAGNLSWNTLAGSGTVDVGVAGQLAWYATSTNEVGGNVFATIPPGGADLSLGNAGGGPNGQLLLYSTTAAKGHLAFFAADNTNNVTTLITQAPQIGARTYTIPEAGANADFVMTDGAQTLNGIKTFNVSPIVPNATTAQQVAAFGQIASAITAGAFLPLAGGTMTGVINANSHKITNVTQGTVAGDAITFPVDTTQIAANAVTQSTTVNNTPALATGAGTIATTSLTTVGGSVLVLASGSIIYNYLAGGLLNGSIIVGIRVDGGSLVSVQSITLNTSQPGAGGWGIPFSLVAIHTPSTASHTYTLEYATTIGAPTSGITFTYNLVAIELKR